ncbi:hypothetical protein TNCV_3039781 [Trichonephila clavipes]|uniref:Uncharacterized protein n=1 Tax=Trichonephila clavipes TaxID=2585209 RepID=A0A8X6RR66_TRICX|nr:hypothetical protein TNCV_3039781 [Trichonephila clavipes]
MSQILQTLFILGLDFLKEHGFTLDFNKNELRSIHEEVTIFKIEHRTESIRQVTANENITIPPRTEIIVPGYIGNDKGEVLANLQSSNLCLQKFELAPIQLASTVDSDLLENAELSPNRKAPQKDCSKNLKTCFLETVAILAILQ